MAIVQISQITNRLGLNTDLPQLAGGELGWSVDTRQLYIGNGTLAEGAPVIGNTEILTEFSDILNIGASYTYKGPVPGIPPIQTGPSPSTPVVQSLQTWMDQWATVKDFGAVGDGVTDDTDAINRALKQLYCLGNPNDAPVVGIRRTLFFPAGVYLVSGTINIPSYATLVGDGRYASIIRMVGSGGTGTHVAQTADSLQQTGINIGNGGAVLPVNISINFMTFETLDLTKSNFLVQSAERCEFNSVIFSSFEPASSFTNNLRGTACVNFASDISVTSNITFDKCRFVGSTYGVYTLKQTKGIVITNSTFSRLFQGIMLGVGAVIGGGPSGTRITNNLFDAIYREGIVFGGSLNPGLNASAYNIFYDVGNEFGGITNPSSSIIVILSNNNLSIGDMFERSNAYAANFPQVEVGDSLGATLNYDGLQVGSKTIESGQVVTLVDSQTGATAFSVDVGLGNLNSPITSFKIDYNIVQGTKYRTGTCLVSSAGGGIVTFTDDYNENAPMNVYLYADQAGTVVNFDYNTTPPSGLPSTFYYSISYLN